MPESAHFAGQHGDGLMTVGGQIAEIYRQIVQHFEQGAREAGKEPSPMPKLLELNVAYTNDELAAIACMKQYWAGTFLPALFGRKNYTPREATKNGDVVGAEIIKQRMCLSANADDHVRYAQQHSDLGFTHLFYHCAGPNQRTFLTEYGRDVLTAIRQGEVVTA